MTFLAGRSVIIGPSGGGASSIPATTVDFTNPYGSPAVVSFFGGTVSSIKLNGQQIYGASNVVVNVGANDVLNLTYTVAPSWIWWPQ